MAEKTNESGGSLAPIYDRMSTAGGYHPFTAETFADWSLESGDVVTLTKEGKNYQSPVYTSRMVWRGAPETSMETTGNLEREAVAKLGNRKYGGGGGGYRNTDLIDTRFTQTQEMIAMEAWDRQDQYKQFYSNFMVTARKISAVVTKSNENGEMLKQAGFELTEEGFLVYAVDATKPLYITSMLQVLADSIRAEINAANSNIYSYINMTASDIQSEVGNALSGMYSHITQTATEIRSEVYMSNSNIYSYITQTASGIKMEVGNSLSGMYSSITQTASEIRSEVYMANSNIYSFISQTASGIKTEVGNALSGVYSSITQTASSIRAEVGQTFSGLDGRISAFEGSQLWIDRDNIVSSVGTITSLDGRLATIEGSTIWQNRTSITAAVGKMYVDDQNVLHIRSGSGLKLDKTVGQETASFGVYTSDNLTAGVLVEKINNGTNVTIRADKVNLEGYVTASQLTAVNASIDNLTSGVTKASILRGTQVNADQSTISQLNVTSDLAFYGSSVNWRTLKIGQLIGISILSSSTSTADFDHCHDITASANNNGNVTITIGQARDSSGTASFNMADTAWYAGRVSAIKTAVSSALGSAGWNSSSYSTRIYASLDTTNKRLNVTSAVAYISYPGESSATAVSLSLGNLDLTSQWPDVQNLGTLGLRSLSGSTFRVNQYNSDDSQILKYVNGEIFLDNSPDFTRNTKACVRQANGSQTVANLSLSGYWDAAQAAASPSIGNLTLQSFASSSMFVATQYASDNTTTLNTATGQIYLSDTSGNYKRTTSACVKNSSGTQIAQYSLSSYWDAAQAAVSPTSQRTAESVTGTISSVSKSGNNWLGSGTVTVFYDDTTSTAGLPLSINVNSAYNKGYTDGSGSVTQRTPTSLSGITLTSSDTGSNVSKTVTVFCSDDSEYDLSTRVNATAVYNKGWNDCIDYMTANNGKSCLIDYTTWKPGAMRALYDFDDGIYSKATGANQYWRYSGSVVTRYSLPDRK